MSFKNSKASRSQIKIKRMRRSSSFRKATIRFRAPSIVCRPKTLKVIRICFRITNTRATYRTASAPRTQTKDRTLQGHGKSERISQTSTIAICYPKSSKRVYKLKRSHCRTRVLSPRLRKLISTRWSIRRILTGTWMGAYKARLASTAAIWLNRPTR